MDPRTLYVDCDDTLIMHDLSSLPNVTPVTLSIRNREFLAKPNQKNINLLVKFYKLGYDIYVWSKTGKSWAEEVVKKLDLSPYITGCLTKPDFLLDDRAPNEWLGPVIWRSPKDE